MGGTVVEMLVLSPVFYIASFSELEPVGLDEQGQQTGQEHQLPSGGGTFHNTMVRSNVERTGGQICDRYYREQGIRITQTNGSH